MSKCNGNSQKNGNEMCNFQTKRGGKSQSDKRQVWRKTNNKTREKRNVKQGDRNKPRQKRDHRWVG